MPFDKILELPKNEIKIDKNLLSTIHISCFLFYDSPEMDLITGPCEWATYLNPYHSHA